MLEQVQLLSSQGWEYSLQASYLEVYNETLRDLLAPTGHRQAGQTIGDLNAIRHDPSGTHACRTRVHALHSTVSQHVWHPGPVLQGLWAPVLCCPFAQACRCTTCHAMTVQHVSMHAATAELE